MSFIYAVPNATAGAAAPKTQITATAPSSGKVNIRGMVLGWLATATRKYELKIDRLTVDATGTAAAINPLDPDVPAARFSAKSTITAEGTSGTTLKEFAIEQVGGPPYIYWWQEDECPVFSNGGIIGLILEVGIGTNNAIGTMYFQEPA